MNKIVTSGRSILLFVLMTIAFVFGCKTTNKDTDTRLEKNSNNSDATLIGESSNTVKKPEYHRSLIGKTYSKLSGLKELKNYQKGYKAIAIGENFALTEKNSGDTSLLIFEEVIKMDGPIPKFRILDTLLLQIDREKQILEFGVCYEGKEMNDQIIAKLKIDTLKQDGEWLDKVIDAWKTDTVRRKMVPIHNFESIRCFQESS